MNYRETNQQDHHRGHKRAQLRNALESTYVFDHEMPDLMNDMPLLALVVAMEHMREGRANPPIPDTPLATPHKATRLAARFFRMLRQLQSPQSIDTVVQFDSKPTKGVDACQEAESKFVGSVRGDSWKYLRPARIVVDDEGEAILYSKSLGQPSTLTLKTIAVNGVEIEPGTIVDMPIKPRSRIGTHELSHTLLIHELSGPGAIHAIMPVRPATFTLPNGEGNSMLEQVREHLPGDHGSYFDEIKTSLQTTVDDFYGI